MYYLLWKKVAILSSLIIQTVTTDDVVTRPVGLVYQSMYAQRMHDVLSIHIECTFDIRRIFCHCIVYYNNFKTDKIQFEFLQYHANRKMKSILRKISKQR